ncbi:MAG: PEP-CTERM sorting domain-containing protein [Gammaproteobacteria bacterium]
MKKYIYAIVLCALTSLGLSSQAFATLILDTYASGTATPTTIGGYTMTDFAITNGGAGIEGTTTTSAASPISGSLNFVDKNSNPLALTRRLADNVSWWVNGEASDYDIFTTDQHLVTILLPENTRAFSFNVGANLGSASDNAWLTATESSGSGINNKYWFNVSSSNTPGFGIHTNNSDGVCSVITSVTIEPDYWGAGNFSINQDSCSTSVPEPSSVALLGLGLFGFGVFSRKLA